MGTKTHTKVVRFRILKPADGRSWKELQELLKAVRYRVFRLANLAVSEAYLKFHMFRMGQAESYKTETIGKLNQRLRQMLIDEAEKAKKANSFEPDLFSPTGALPDTVVGALSQYKIRAITNKSKWSEIIRGQASLPTFRLNMSIPVRCDKPGQRRLKRADADDVEVELMICRKPYPRVVLATREKGMGESQLVILNRILDNKDQSIDGYRQRCFEIKHDERFNKWWLYVTYTFPASENAGLSKDVIVGADLGVSCPMYAAISNGHARIGRRHFKALGARIHSLQRQTVARRRSIQTGGRSSLSAQTARSGHGRKRKLKAIEPLEGRIENAYTTLNHQLSASLVDFARQHGAGVIQIEDLTSLKDHLRGTFIGMNWRYHQLQSFIKYKGDEAGIEVRTINPRFTSRRCSKCGHINAAFDRAARDSGERRGFSARFECPECRFTADPDYNAARNLTVLDIEQQIAQQCRRQDISADALSQEETEAVEKGTLADSGNRGPAAEAGPAPAQG
jgi:IS605 OrfB family transposase